MVKCEAEILIVKGKVILVSLFFLVLLLLNGMIVGRHCCLIVAYFELGQSKIVMKQGFCVSMLHG